MAGPRNTFKQIGWATTYFLQFWVGHKAILICLVTKFKNNIPSLRFDSDRYA